MRIDYLLYKNISYSRYLFVLLVQVQRSSWYVRALSLVEQAGMEAGLRANAFSLRRSQMLLASSRKQRSKEIAYNPRCATQTVRNAIHAFERLGLSQARVFSAKNRASAV
jgi:hypothetical protein